MGKRWGLSALALVGVSLYSARAAALCGDGVVEFNEECDDGNVAPNDGCSASCLTEAGYVCRGEPGLCAVTCGDGVLAPTEDCDDGNARSGDGCSATCEVEDGWDCTNQNQTVYVQRRGVADCRNFAGVVDNSVLAPADAEPAITAGMWRARYVGGIVQYGNVGLYTAGILAMTHSGKPTGVCLNGGTESALDCVYGDRSTRAAQLASVLNDARQEYYDFSTTNDPVRVGLVDDDCAQNSGDVTYRFDTLSVCSPSNACTAAYAAPSAVVYQSGLDAFGRDAANLIDGAGFIPSPKRPGALYAGDDTTTATPEVGAVLRFSFAAPQTLTDLYLWQNYGSDTEGLTQFGLTSRDAAGAALGAEQLFNAVDCNCMRVPATRFELPAVDNVSMVDLRVVQSQNGTHAQLVETLFVGSPYCNDGNACTTDSCALGVCGTTALAAGEAGSCGGGLVCSGPAANACVVPAPTIDSPADGATTTDTSPTISGSCVTGATVTVFEGADVVCTAPCEGSAYSCTPSTPLALGTHSLTASQSSGATPGLSSAPRSFEITELNDGGVDDGGAPDGGISDASVPDASTRDAAAPDASRPGRADASATPDSPDPSAQPELDITGGACSQSPRGNATLPWLLLPLALIPLARRRRR